MAKSKRKSVGTLVVQSKVKDYVREGGFRVGGDFVDALSEEIEILLDAAMDRAATNKRQTLRAGDL